MICPKCNGTGKVEVWEDITRECTATLERYEVGIGILPLLKHGNMIIAHLTPSGGGIWEAMPNMYKVEPFSDRIKIYQKK